MGELLSSSYEVGKRLLPQAVDYLGEFHPQKLFATYHGGGDDYQTGWIDLNFDQLAKAVDWTSWWIEKILGKSTNLEVVAYMGAKDVRYSIFTTASIKTGRASLLPSPRGSIEGFVYLITQSGCKDFFFSSEQQTKVREVKARVKDVRFWQTPTLAEMLAGRTVPYPFSKTFDEAENDWAIIIHSSGSTGLPKLVPMTNGYLAVQDRFSLIPEMPDGRRAIWTVMAPDERCLCINPLFHLMGLNMLQESIFHGIPTILGPDRPMTAEILADILTTTKPTIGILPPSLIEDLSRSEVGRVALSSLRTTITGGAALSQDVAARISKLTRLVSVYGASEIGTVACLIPKSKDDYNYLEWHPKYGIIMDPVDDGLYEAVLRRSSTSDFQAVWHSFPELQEYRTNDLFTKHPEREGLWLYTGRRDDVIVLSNGEKFNPINMEKYIEEHPSVKRALVIGQSRFQAALLVEPDWATLDDKQSEDVFIDNIWAHVEMANLLVASHGRIMKSHISCTARDLPFKTTPKGNTQRKAVCEEYAKRIDDIYTRGEVIDNAVLPEHASVEQIADFVLQVVSESLEGTPISPTSDLFSSGLDSLQTQRLAKVLQGTIVKIDSSKKDAITAATLYKIPTASKIAKFIYDLLNADGTSDSSPTVHESSAYQEKAVDRLVQKYTASLPRDPINIPTFPKKNTVILTGSTGFLGNYLLDRLLRDPLVAHIYCLNRAADAFARTKASFEQKELDFSQEVQSKVSFWQAQFGEERFGLGEKEYDLIRLSTTLVIHNAWKVDFKHSLESFESTHISGVRRLIDFCLASPLHPHLNFVSSVSTIGRWDYKNGPSCPESPHNTIDIVVPSGYGLSKYTAERIFHVSAQLCGVPSTIIRVGQIGGPTVGPGYWNKTDWIPMLIKTSQAIAAVPDTLSYMPVDFVPGDMAASVVVEFAQARQTSQNESRCEFFHLINPTRVTWESLLPAIHRRFAAKVVSFTEWVDKVKLIKLTDNAISETPAVKLVDFLEGLESLRDWKQPPWETLRAQKASKTLRDLPPFNADLMALYLRQWNF
ncbi:uncharacterized protein A1O9_06917 [Exophiala aquamarina CBS 119918]|uniref:Carrier domain-containing protein n=1 Tax=Exophiala aquamarina CBS 119918 TaxID=1182545 RepID=A0A072PAF1_9EURO|nr:uncharacterized protein A1O9_06917 [Exophiala aquamarina CBS 119918]KEF56727.1 hypothetical protein A1O9_06917 [Exophiala aquamarina CBS 119918]